MTDFSLFEGDLLNRCLARIGLRSRGFQGLGGRFALLLIVTCLPTAFFAWRGGFGPWRSGPLNFFGDLAALGQAFLGYPLFIMAESIIGTRTRDAGKHFAESGLVRGEDLRLLDRLHEQVGTLRRSWIPEAVCFLLGFVFALFWLWEETHNGYNTWHAIGLRDASGVLGVQRPTLAGWWVALVGIPVFNFWWLRWIWKIVLWCWYLRGVSRLRLRLIASHPDQTGGLGFLSEAQASYAIAIFAFGIGLIAPLVSYKVEVEHADLLSFSVAGPLLGFLIGAPLFFSSPLLLFTKQLRRTKNRAALAYQDRATAAAIQFEKHWLNACEDEDCERLLGYYLGGMNNLNQAYAHIKKMRVVPFDTRSFGQLFGSTFGSLVPVVLQAAGAPPVVIRTLEGLKSLLTG